MRPQPVIVAVDPAKSPLEASEMELTVEPKFRALEIRMVETSLGMPEQEPQ